MRHTSILEVEKLQAARKNKNIVQKTIGLKGWKDQELARSVVYHIISPPGYVQEIGLLCSFTVVLLVGNLLCIMKMFLINQRILFILA